MKILEVSLGLGRTFTDKPCAISKDLTALAEYLDADVKVIDRKANVKHDKLIALQIYRSDSKRWPKLFDVLNEIRYAFAVARYVRKHAKEYDIIHLHTLYPALLTSYAANTKKMFYTCHNPMWSGPIVSVYDRISRRLEKHAMSRMKHNIVVGSAYLKFPALKGLNLKYIPNGMKMAECPLSKKEARKKLKVKDDQKVILFVGRIDHAKGIDLLLKAFKGLKIQGKKLIIIGPHSSRLEGKGIDGFAKKILQESAKDVQIHNELDNREVMKYMKAADVLCLPSRHEAQGLVLLETLMNGTPVVGSDVGGIPDMIKGNNGFIFRREDVKSLQNALE